ncbi:MAG: iron-sulfur cluster assembly scaffold protein [Halopseudomonas sp.]
MNIYSEKIKGLAAASDQLCRLEQQATTVVKSNPICGDRITLDLRRVDSQVEIGMEVRGCLICKASAALLDQLCNNQDVDHIFQFEKELKGVLQADNPMVISSKLTKDVAVFLPLVSHKNRHHCALLPLDTLISALDKSPE